MEDTQLFNTSLDQSLLLLIKLALASIALLFSFLLAFARSRRVRSLYFKVEAAIFKPKSG